MTSTFCFLTKNQIVTNTEIKRVEIEFKRRNLRIINQTRLGLDGVVLEVQNFTISDFSDLEKTLAMDINFSNKPAKIKRLFLADMDGTLINCECIDELADYAGVQNKVAKITERAMNGDLDFSKALRQRVKLLKGLTLKQLTDCYNKKITLNKGAKTLVKTMKQIGSTTALVSGGFSFFADKLATDVGFDHVYANDLMFEGNKLSGNVRTPIMDRTKKKLILQKLCKEKNFTKHEVLAVGDGANDIDMISEAGLGVSYFGKMGLTLKADFKLFYSDLRALLYFQGIKEDDFVL